MAQFLDNKKRPWNLDLSGPTIELIRGKTCRDPDCKHDPHEAPCKGVDLADLKGKAMDRLGDDPVLLVRVVTMLVTPQLQVTGISSTDFGEALVGDGLGNATDALLESIADFFHGQKRVLVKAMAEKSKRLTDLGITKAMEKIGDPRLETRVMEAMEQRMEAALKKALTQSDSATDSPASLE